MAEILIILASITLLFVSLLFLQAKTGFRFCALCAASLITWLGFLILYWLEKFQNLMLLAPLLGATAVGVYYLAEKKTKEELHLFRLPFFLTLLLFVYFLLGEGADDLKPFLFLMGLWFLFGIVFLFRQNPKFAKLAKRIIECCKNW